MNSIGFVRTYESFIISSTRKLNSPEKDTYNAQTVGHSLQKHNHEIPNVHHFNEPASKSLPIISSSIPVKIDNETYLNKYLERS